MSARFYLPRGPAYTVVDWSNPIGAQHYFGGAEHGDIRYTEPLLNHLHHLEPLCEYLERYARRAYSDHSGRRLMEVTPL
ncbi:hypothetical protein FJZ36_13720 [Candidatus Poribacteria bacterium]|nr:hypothetical protein [Candidatus Poribacteria bacterium]